MPIVISQFFVLGINLLFGVFRLISMEKQFQILVTV